MEVETTDGDLGERDISAPKVSDVVRDRDGAVEKVVVEKGVVFRKHIAVPVERIRSVDPEPKAGEPHGEVTIAASEHEVDALTAAGTEELSTRKRPPHPEAGDPLASVEEELPTAEGLRRKEAGSVVRERRQSRAATLGPTAAPAYQSHAGRDVTCKEDAEQQPQHGWQALLRTIGPGFLSGMAGNDSSAVTAYSVNGATNGYSQLWLMLLATPLYQAVQYACARVGRVTQQGLAELLREHYGLRVAVPAALILIVANAALIASDLSAIGSGLELVTGIRWTWFIIPAAAFLWYVTVYQNFAVIKRVFVVMSLVFVAYIITGAMSGADWGAVVRATFIPHIGLDFVSISTAVALLGATVSPYTMFWQVQGEKEEERPGRTKRQQMHWAAADILSGTISGNLVAYFIIVATSATLFTHHETVATAADAARALEPLLGPYAKYLFAIGFVGAGIVAIPVLLASTSYALSGLFGWTASLWRKPWQSEGFYLILTGALVLSLVVALLGVDPIQLMFWANVLQGVLAPVLVVFIFLAGNSKRIMKHYRLGKATNAGLVITALLMAASALLLFYGLLTGHDG
jgi:NRAMP (natural resistance-associated macrophage protein)-like metal ion transporter